MTDNVNTNHPLDCRALAEKVTHIIAPVSSQTGIIMREKIEEVESLLRKFEITISDKWHKAGYEDGKRFAFSEAAEIAETYPGPGGYVDCDSFEPKDVMIAFAKGIAAKLRQKAGE